VKYHYLHLHEFTDGIRLRQGLAGWFNYYNRECCHQALDDRTPDELYYAEPLKEAA